MSPKEIIVKRNEKAEEDNKLENNNNNIEEKIIQELEQKDTSVHIKNNFKSGNYQYMINNNCSSSNKSKDKDTKSKQTKYLIANNEVLNHLIYFTNYYNKTGMLQGSTAKTKSDPSYKWFTSIFVDYFFIKCGIILLYNPNIIMTANNSIILFILNLFEYHFHCILLFELLLYILYTYLS